MKADIRLTAFGIALTAFWAGVLDGWLLVFNILMFALWVALFLDETNNIAGN